MELAAFPAWHGPRSDSCSIAYGTATPPAACNVAYDGVGNIVSQPDRNNHSRTFTYFPSGQVATIARGDTGARPRSYRFGRIIRLCSYVANPLSKN